MIETSYQRVGRLQRERKAAREAQQLTKQKTARKRRRNNTQPNWHKIADHIDGYDRDDLGESPDY